VEGKRTMRPARRGKEGGAQFSIPCVLHGDNTLALSKSSLAVPVARNREDESAEMLELTES